MKVNRLYRVLCNLHAQFATKREEGATMVEYGLVVALIAGACIGAITLIGTDLSAIFSAIAGDLSRAP